MYSPLLVAVLMGRDVHYQFRLHRILLERHEFCWIESTKGQEVKIFDLILMDSVNNDDSFSIFRFDDFNDAIYHAICK